MFQKLGTHTQSISSCGSIDRVGHLPIRRPVVRSPSSLVHMWKSPWARHWTPNCECVCMSSWWAGCRRVEPLVCECVCDWVNADLCFKKPFEWLKDQKSTYKYSQKYNTELINKYRMLKCIYHSVQFVCTSSFACALWVAHDFFHSLAQV